MPPPGGRPPGAPPPTAARPPGGAGRPPFVPGAGSEGSSKRPRKAPLIAAIVALIGLLAGAGAVLVLRDGTAGATEVFAEPSTEPGPDPFTSSVAAPDLATTTTTAPATTAPATLATTTSPTTAGAVITSKVGDNVGLYGGSLDIAVCDASKLVDFLTTDAAKGRAWAQAQGIPQSEIPRFVATLTPVILRDDVRVTNHGFDPDTLAPTPRQSILQRGSAVLVDRSGVPRVRCYCGNPLQRPNPVRQKLVGRPWPDFDPAKVVQINPAPRPVETFVLVNLADGSRLERPAGSAIGTSSPSTTASPTTASPTTAAPTSAAPPPTAVPVTTAAATTTAPPQPVELTELGVPAASSVFGGNEFPAALALDGDLSTSWFSAGPSGGAATFSLSLPGAHTIQRIAVVGNAGHATPAFQRNFGFEQVIVEVRNAGAVTYTQQVALNGTPDPDVALALNAVGDEVRLVFTGSEDPGCGGFSELSVIGF
jgi:hypothetical protein